jgi:hypothetical protein
MPADKPQSPAKELNFEPLRAQNVTARGTARRSAAHERMPNHPTQGAIVRLVSSWAILEGQITIVLESTSHEKTGATGGHARSKLV